MGVQIITMDGRERVLMDRADYDALVQASEDLADARFLVKAMDELAQGAETFTGEELDAYLAAPTPLAFWRARSGKTQAMLAKDVGVSQAFMAQLETGRRKGSIDVLSRIAKALDLRIDDLVE